MEEREFLMIPGPVSVDDDVLAALARPVRAHYGDGWTRLYNHAVGGMREVFGTEGDVFLLFGSGMAGVEMCIASVLSPGDEVIVASNGLFGDRMADVAVANGLQVHVVRAGPAEAVTAEMIRAALDDHRDTRAVCVVHHETSAGILNEVQAIASLARERSLLAARCTGPLLPGIGRWGSRAGLRATTRRSPKRGPRSSVLVRWL